MSVLTEVCLYVSCVHDKSLEERLRDLDFEEGPHTQRLNKLNTHEAGGSKVFSTQIWAACFNHISPDRVIKRLESFAWDRYSAVAIIEYEFKDGLVIWRNNE